jgi:serine/threonine protein kinase
MQLLHETQCNMIYACDRHVVKSSKSRFRDAGQHEKRMNDLVRGSPLVCCYVSATDDSLIFEMANSDLLTLCESHEKALPSTMVRRCLLSLLGAVSHIHRLGVAHLDISLENILVFGPDDIRLSDFGSSVTISEYKNPSGYKKLNEPLYIKHATDVDAWQCGIVCLNLMLNLAPWDGMEKLQTMLVNFTLSEILDYLFKFNHHREFEPVAKTLLLFMEGEGDDAIHAAISLLSSN